MKHKKFSLIADLDDKTLAALAIRVCQEMDKRGLDNQLKLHTPKEYTLAEATPPPSKLHD